MAMADGDTGDLGQYRKMAEAQASAPPPLTTIATTAGVTGQLAGMSVQDSGPPAVAEGAATGSSPVMAVFRGGSVVVLQSVTSRHTLCVSEGEISGKGTRDANSEFRVHVWSSGKVALQNMSNPDNWLTVYGGKTLGSGQGGPYAEFILHEIEGKYVALESAIYPGQHVGVREDGELQPPGETPALDRASLFVPFLHSPPPSSVPVQWTEAAPQPGELPPPYPGPPSDGFASAAAMKGAEAMASALPTLPSYQPPSHMPPPNHSGPYPPQGPYHPPGHTVLDHPSIPLGYEVMDLFNKFNSLHLIPREDSHLTDHPLEVAKGLLDFKHPKLKTGGSFNSPASEILAETSPDGNIALRNPASQTALCCYSQNKLFMGEDATAYRSEHLFTVRSIHRAIVAFESVKFPLHFLSVNKNGVVVLEKQEMKAICIHFNVYVNRFKGPYSRVLTSPFASGRPSVVGKLKDMSVIQLYSRKHGLYLSLGRKVQASDTEDDGTFLLFRDRGMGRVSFTSYFGRKKLRIDHNGHLSTDSHEKYKDFYVRECPSGALLFESIVFPKEVVHMAVGKKKDKERITEFSVYLLDRTKTQGTVGYKTIPKYALN